MQFVHMFTFTMHMYGINLSRSVSYTTSTSDSKCGVVVVKSRLYCCQQVPKGTKSQAVLFYLFIVLFMGYHVL